MGQVKRLLFSKKLGKEKPDWYADKIALETNESLHLHWDNYRLEFLKEEWAFFCDKVALAFKTWKDLGQPNLNKENDNAKTIYLPSAYDIPQFPRCTPLRFDVEEQENVPTIHIHYRKLRLELSKEEWKEFAEGIIESYAKYKG